MYIVLSLITQTNYIQIGNVIKKNVSVYFINHRK